MAAEHEDWIASLFAGLDDRDVAELMRLLGKLKASARRSEQTNGGGSGHG